MKFLYNIIVPLFEKTNLFWDLKDRKKLINSLNDNVNKLICKWYEYLYNRHYEGFSTEFQNELKDDVKHLIWKISKNSYKYKSYIIKKFVTDNKLYNENSIYNIVESLLPDQEINMDACHLLSNNVFNMSEALINKNYKFII